MCVDIFRTWQTKDAHKHVFQAADRRNHVVDVVERIEPEVRDEQNFARHQDEVGKRRIDPSVGNQVALDQEVDREAGQQRDSDFVNESGRCLRSKAADGV